MTKTTLIITAAALTMSAPAFAQTLTLENFVGTVEIVPGSRLKVDGADKVDISNGNVTVDGGMTLKNVSCYSWNGGERTIKVNGKKGKLSDYPSLRITAPSDTDLVITDSLIYGQASDLGSADISMPSCGNFNLADVDGILTVRLSGSADITAHTVGDATLTTSGSGDYEIDRIRGAATLKTSGSGDFAVGQFDDGFEFRSTGSGDLEADRVTGDVDARMTGSGDVSIGSGSIGRLMVRTTGSGDFYIDGDVGDIDAVSTGSGDISARSYSGKLKARKTGSGDIVVAGVEID